MADALYGGCAFRTLNVIDEGNREILGIEIATSIPARRAIRVMEQLIEIHGKPRALRLDNGSELTSVAFTEWCAEKLIELRFIQPGKPNRGSLWTGFSLGCCAPCAPGHESRRRGPAVACRGASARKHPDASDRPARNAAQPACLISRFRSNSRQQSYCR